MLSHVYHLTFENRDEADALTKGWPNNVHRRYTNFEELREDWIRGCLRGRVRGRLSANSLLPRVVRSEEVDRRIAEYAERIQHELIRQRLRALHAGGSAYVHSDAARQAAIEKAAATVRDAAIRGTAARGTAARETAARETAVREAAVREAAMKEAETAARKAMIQEIEAAAREAAAREAAILEAEALEEAVLQEADDDVFAAALRESEAAMREAEAAMREAEAAEHPAAIYDAVAHEITAYKAAARGPDRRRPRSPTSISPIRVASPARPAVSTIHASGSPCGEFNRSRSHSGSSDVSSVCVSVSSVTTSTTSDPSSTRRASPCSSRGSTPIEGAEDKGKGPADGLGPRERAVLLALHLHPPPPPQAWVVIRGIEPGVYTNRYVLRFPHDSF